MRRIRVAVLSSLLAVAIGVGVAHAGYSTNYFVTLTSGAEYQYASGNLRAARTASDVNQFIGCSHYANLTTGAAPYILCFARNSAGTYLTCQTSDPSLMRTAELINSSSYLYFMVSKFDSTCSAITVTNASYFLPAQ
jgi:hypothetical protein